VQYQKSHDALKYDQNDMLGTSLFSLHTMIRDDFFADFSVFTKCTDLRGLDMSVCGTNAVVDNDDQY